MGFVSYLWGM